MESGEDRVIEVEALGDSGFFLKTGGYGAWAGSQARRRGRASCTSTVSTSPTAGATRTCAQLGQFRDTPIRVREGDAVGYGIMESLIGGVWPELGLSDESDHKVSYT